MPFISCFVCKREVYKSPSKVAKRPCCSRKCQIEIAKIDVIEVGKKFRFNAETSKLYREKAMKALSEKTTGASHYSWKGEEVGYRGLHQWVRRKKGKPIKCIHCGKQSDKPKLIQWANIDGKYRRHIDDFISLCASCHKKYDLRLGSIRGARSANQLHS
jgi:hypothetical protein